MRITKTRNILLAALALVILSTAWWLRGARIGNPVTFANVIKRSTVNRYGLSTKALLANVEHTERLKTLFNSAQQGTFLGANRVHIVYRLLVQPPALEKAAIVISSGRTESSELYKELIYDLYQQGYSVYIHDHRGQGFSDRLYLDDVQRSHVDNFDFYVDDLHQFIETYVRPSTHSRVFLLAHSMGGGIATRYVERYHDGIAALALVTPMEGPLVELKGIDLSKPFCAASRTHLLSSLLSSTEFGLGQTDWHAVSFRDNDLTHSQLRYLMRDQVTHKLGGVTHGWFRQTCRASDEMLSSAEKIKIPVLVLQAGGDTAVSNRAQKAFCERVNASGGRCDGFALPDSYHAIFIEDDDFRGPALATILDFFKSHLAEPKSA